ncbi:MAG: ABC transporter ATP-binding protein [Thermodesulforhabdaceae bacterium]
MPGLAIDMQNVFFIRQGKEILRDFSWQVEEGINWVLMGPNGSGKTTILKLLAGYIWPTKGSVSVLGHRFGEVDLRRLRQQIGWVGSFLQEHIAFEQTPRDIILSGRMGSLWLYEKPDRSALDLAEKMADLVGCAGLMETPYGLLSQGEKQRILLARALIARPRLLLLDEPCAGLDIVAREHFLRVLSLLPSKLSAPVTIILVTHHLEEITSLFSHVLLLKEGMSIAQGTVSEVLQDVKLTELFGVPIQNFSFNGRYYAHIRWDGDEGEVVL